MGISREAQDEYATNSYKRSQDAAARGIFAREIIPVTVPLKRGEVFVQYVKHAVESHRFVQYSEVIFPTCDV